MRFTGLFNGVAMFLQGCSECFTVGFAAYFTHNVNGGLVRCDVRFEPVVFNGQDVCTGFCNDAQHFYQASGSVQQSYGKLHSSVSGEQALFNDVLYKADVNVSAREQTDNLFYRSFLYEFIR